MKTQLDASNQANFRIGELVWWTDIKNIESKKFGIIQKLFKIEKGGRYLWYAEVFCFEKQQIKNILTTILHKMIKK